jgi:hypothetical protein
MLISPQAGNVPTSGTVFSCAKAEHDGTDKRTNRVESIAYFFIEKMGVGVVVVDGRGVGAVKKNGACRALTRKPDTLPMDYLP